MFNDFPHDILEQEAHRPWPMPDGPWLMTQSWHDLLFAHWPVDAGDLRLVVPASLPLDRFDGHAWLGIVSFHMTNVAPRGMPALPGLSAFAELNVRTYVTLDGKPGVYFFSLDAASRLAVTTARQMFGLPYFLADMQVERDADAVRYRSRRSGDGDAEFVARYRGIGPPATPEAGTLVHFLTERYCLYTDQDGTPHRLEIHHPAWPLQAAEATIERNTMASAAGITLPSTAPLVHFVKRQDMVAFAMHEARAGEGRRRQ